MSTRLLDGNGLKRMLLGGSEGVKAQIETINDLNVFPVPDGDTGTNMAKTIEGGVCKILSLENADVGEMMVEFSKGALFGARGNSGVILSQYFKGVALYLDGKSEVSPQELAEAFLSGVDKAYHAVANPVEGTMLTVFREGAEYGSSHRAQDIESMLEYIIDESKRSLEKTKEILPALIEAGVVDSGGMGYLCFLKGMLAGLLGEEIKVEPVSQATESINYDLFTADSVLEFGYCTECLVRLQNAKGGVDSFDKDAFTRELEAKGCNSIVILTDGDILKLHAHTMTPGDILTMCQRHGEFLNIKIENMSLQHSEKIENQKGPKKQYGVVTVASGEGFKALFSDLGADVVIDGGQTGNPPAEAFLSAFESLNCESIIVLPNNKNIVLTANQAAELWGKGNVYVVPTKTLCQGYSALTMFTEGIEDLDEQIAGMSGAIDMVASCEITEAIRDAHINGIEVKEGQTIGVLDGELVCASATELEAIISTIEQIEDIEDREILTVFVGKGVSDEERIEAVGALEDKFDHLSVEAVIGGQEVYRYLISVE
ncbi:MAG: DAK2 domain-containing protein [Clostridia bacterium]|nr:DAK2 domain-containing protein [Clostridia bacterium]